MAQGNARNTRNGIPFSGSAVKRNAEIAGARFHSGFLAKRHQGIRNQETEQKQKGTIAHSVVLSCRKVRLQERYESDEGSLPQAANTCVAANSRAAAIFEHSSAEMMNGGASSTWSPRTPSTHPCVG